MVCPECGKRHKKFPRDCVWQASAAKAISDNLKRDRYEAMKAYCMREGLKPDTSEY